jgi:glycosyltransferase involved in cell wall biosynthesis
VSIPTFRPDDRLTRAIQSVLDQTHHNIAVIVVNDGVARFPNRLLPRDDRLIRFDLASNRGRYYADAVTLAAATTTWWTPHDSDDWSNPDRLEHLLAAADPTRDFIMGGYLRHRLTGETDAVYPSPRLMVGAPRRLRHVAHHTALWRTESLRAIGGPDPSYRVAYDTLQMALAINLLRWRTVAEPRYHYHERTDSLMRSTDVGWGSPHRKEAWRRRQEAWDYFRQHHQIAPRPDDDLAEMVHVDAARLADLL